MWIALAIGQFYILLRHYVKLLFYASQIAYFQGELAHAATRPRHPSCGQTHRRLVHGNA